jgi:hypothetical protein
MAGDTTKITLGPITVSWKAYVAGTYTSGFTDFGCVSEKGAKFKYKGKELEIACGNQLGVIKRLLTQEEAELEVNGLEFTIENIATALGIAAADIEDDETNHYKYVFIGGQTANLEWSVKLTSVLSDATTLTIVLYRCNLSRDQKLEFAPDKVMETPLKFKALGDTHVSFLRKLGYAEVI